MTVTSTATAVTARVSAATRRDACSARRWAGRAVGCDRLPEAFHGKEGVDGSSPSEESAANRRFFVRWSEPDEEERRVVHLMRKVVEHLRPTLPRGRELQPNPR
jgi:hypothetical protein